MGLNYRGDLNRPLTAAEIDGNFQHFTGSHAVTGSVTASLGFYGDVTGDVTGTASFALDSAGQVVEVTYQELDNKLDEGELVPGKYYLITDFRTVYDRPDFYIDGNKKYDGIVTASGSISSLMVLATSRNTIAEEAYQPEFRNDKIKYDITFRQTDQKGLPAFGRITERIDEYNNRTDYDHRVIEFKRYLSYEQSTQQTGTIVSYNCLTGELVGDGSTVFTNLSEGDVLMIDTRNYGGWDYNVAIKINSIQNDNLIIAHIDPLFNNANFSGYNANFYSTYGIDNTNYKEYYVGQSIVDGSTLFRTFNRLDNGQVVGNYIGDHSKYYLQELSSNSGFLLANNVFLNQCYSNKIGDRSYNNTGRQWFINNVIGNKFHNNIIWRGFYQNRIASDFTNNILEYSVYGNVIGRFFEWNYTTGNNGYIYDNTIGDGFYSNEIKNQIRNNTIGSWFQDNNIDSDLYENKIGDNFYNNRVYNDVYNNVIGNGFGSNGISGSFGYNNVRDRFYRNDIYNIFTKNTIADNFEFNTIGQDGYNNYYNFENNVIGGYCKGNEIQKDFTYNTTLGNFRANGFVEEVRGNKFADETNNNGFQQKVLFNQLNAPFYDNQHIQQMQYNTFDCSVNGVDWTYATHIGQDYNCRIYIDRTDGIQLSIMDEGLLLVANVTD